MAGFGSVSIASCATATMTAPTMSTATSVPTTAQPMVPPGEAPTATRRRRIMRGVWIGVAVTFLLGVIGASVLPVPYYALRPGDARPLAGLVSVEGADEFPTDSPVAFTTVKVGRTTLMEALVGWFDDDVDVVPAEVIEGDRTEEETDRYNQQLMDDSKLIATTVAMERLGYDIPVRTEGVLVEGVVPDQPADGLLERGDVILAVDDEPIDVPGEVRSLLQAGGPGATHVLSVEREVGAPPVEVELTTAAAPDDPGRAVVGIIPRERIVDIELPFEVDVESDDVKGPSAGLAFTLAILDHLSPGELTGGKDVAVTGTMDLEGNVGPVGGAVQKAVAVRDDGFDAFLVPPAEFDEVEARIGDDVEVVAVDSLDEALAALATLGGDIEALDEVGPAPA